MSVLSLHTSSLSVQEQTMKTMYHNILPVQVVECPQNMAQAPIGEGKVGQYQANNSSPSAMIR